MKKCLSILFSLFFSVSLSMAQTNPQPGFIITNSGDTIRGILDFRTNAVLSKKCLFKAQGDNELQTYMPGDIEAFRFENNGKYFVTRRFDFLGTSQLYFAEFLVQGKMNLYCIADDYDDYFFFEREDGEMAQLTNRAILTSSSLAQEKNALQERRKQYGKVKMLLKDSKKAIEDMSDGDMSRTKLVNVVRDYHYDVCTDGSSCMVYEYKAKSEKTQSHFKVFAGYAYYSHERTLNQNLLDETYSGSTFEVGLAAEIGLERMLKGGSAELGVAFSPKTKFSHDVMVLGGREPSHTSYEKSRVTFHLGFLKRFGKGKILPFVRGGGFYTLHSGNKEERYYKSQKVVDIDWSSLSHIGIYLGAGAEMPVDKHFVRLHADWYKSLESSKKGNMMRWGLTAEFAW